VVGSWSLGATIGDPGPVVQDLALQAFFRRSDCCCTVQAKAILTTPS